MKRALLFALALVLTGQACSQPALQEESSMDDDDRLQLTFGQFWGITTYTGNNTEVFSRLDSFTDDDIDLIKRSSNDYSYTKESRKILSDVCDYFEATPRESLDVEYLHTAPLRSHDVEISSKKQFLQNLYGQLSATGKAHFDEVMRNVHLTSSIGRGFTYREDVDFNDPVMIDAIIANTERACPIIREGNERMERNNYIEEPSITAITDNPEPER